jgi:hypothetical protein
VRWKEGYEYGKLSDVGKGYLLEGIIFVFFLIVSVKPQSYLGRVILGFRREADGIRASLWYYATYSDNSLPTFRFRFQWSKNPIFLNLEGRPDRFQRNVDYELPLYVT